MKIKINRDSLAIALQTSSLVIGGKQQMPILSMIHISTKVDHIELRSTNLDQSIKTRCKCSVESHGEISLPAKKLISVIKELPDENVTIDVSESVATILSGKSRFKIVGLTEEYPFEKKDNGMLVKDISEKQLFNMIKTVNHAASTDENRYVLNSIFVESKDGKINFVATDGRRLSFKSTEADGNDFYFILPLSIINQIMNLCAADSNVKIYMVNNRGVLFDFGDTTYYTKTIEGKYPDYKSVIPSGLDNSCFVDREKLLQCINRASLVVSDRKHCVVLSFGNQNLSINSSSNEYGEYEESITADCNEENQVDIAFNPRFLIEALKSINNDTVCLKYNISKKSPIMIDCNDGFQSIIMPLDIN